MSRDFDSHVRGTEREIYGHPDDFGRSTGWARLWWVVTAVCLALVLSGAVVAVVVLRG